MRSRYLVSLIVLLFLSGGCGALSRTQQVSNVLPERPTAFTVSTTEPITEPEPLPEQEQSLTDMLPEVPPPTNETVEWIEPTQPAPEPANVPVATRPRIAPTAAPQQVEPQAAPLATRTDPWPTLTPTEPEAVETPPVASPTTAPPEATPTNTPTSTVSPTAEPTVAPVTSTPTEPVPTATAPPPTATVPPSPTPVYDSARQTPTPQPAPQIIVESPAAGTMLSSPFVVRGSTNFWPFEANLSGVIKDAANNVLASFPVAVHAPTIGQGGPFSEQVTFALPTTEQEGTLELFDVSANDGSIVASTSIRIRLAAAPEPVSSFETEQPVDR
jgi:hypothetical protein